jgi:hypothetical protein
LKFQTDYKNRSNEESKEKFILGYIERMSSSNKNINGFFTRKAPLIDENQRFDSNFQQKDYKKNTNLIENFIAKHINFNGLNNFHQNKNNYSFNTPRIKFKNASSICKNEDNSNYENKYNHHLSNEIQNQLKSVSCLKRSQNLDYVNKNIENINCIKKLNFSTQKMPVIIPLSKREIYKKRLEGINFTLSKSFYKNIEKTDASISNNFSVNGFTKLFQKNEKDMALDLFENLKRFTNLKCDSRNYPIINKNDIMFLIQ